MVEITDYNGRAHYLAVKAIAQVSEAGPSSQWHGIRSLVKTFDGKTIESSETAFDIAQKVQGVLHG